MHYTPESACEFLQQSSAGGERTEEVSLSEQYTPLYLLTGVVGVLLLVDLLLTGINHSPWLTYQSVFGYRLTMWAALFGGARICYQTLDRLFEGKIGADLALTIAVVAALILGENTAAALVVFIALCGESLEGITVDRAKRAIRRSFQLTPKMAHVLKDGQEIDKPIAELQPGARIRIRPGERIPVDGTIVEGTSAVDESALTGESFPIEKQSGDEVFTGTLNQFGSLEVKATRTGADTTLAQVTQLVADATVHKAPLERTADRLARWFLPVVLLMATGTLLFWRIRSGDWSTGFRPALGVLVVACPCPLVLATPTAVMAAMAWLARNGVVVKGSAALERLANVDTIAFDKTGTLTTGELRFGTIHLTDEIDETELLRVAAVAERRSEHPLARLIAHEADARGCVLPDVTDFQAIPGQGVLATVRETVLGPWAMGNSDTPHEEHAVIRVGNRSFLEQHQITIPTVIEEQLQASEQTSLFVAVEQRLLGVITVEDTLRENAADTIRELRETGIKRIAMLTGDRAATANAIGSAVRLGDDLHAELLPQGKAEWVEQQTQDGRRVMMIGDGVNDAPALALATVGLAVGNTGSDLAAEAGDLILLGDPLEPLPALVRLSRALVRNIQQSIILFAFGMNFLGMFLCAIGVLSLVGGAIFHEVASLAVMLNAMRLLWFERESATASESKTVFGSRWSTFNATAAWLTRVCSPTRIALGFARRWQMWVRLAFAGVLVYWLTSGVVRIRSDESAIVTRYGRVHETLEPGLYWRWPPPFERVYRENAGAVRTLQIGFRSQGKNKTEPGQRAIEWTDSHADSHFEPIANEALVLTGDEVPIELTAELHYRIDDLAAYLFATKNPGAVLRANTESTLRLVAASYSLDGLLTENRREIERECLRRVRQQVLRYELGIEVLDLALLDLHPPQAVVPAYREAANAWEEQQQRINEAETYANQKLLTGAGEQAVTLLRPLPRNNADPHDVPGLTIEHWKQLKADPNGLAGEAAAAMLTAEQQATDQLQQVRGNIARLESLYPVYQQHPHLTGIHLYWQQMERTLSGRPMTILDPSAVKTPHLLLTPAPTVAAPLLPQMTAPQLQTEPVPENE